MLHKNVPHQILPEKLPPTARSVITQPRRFFQDMPVSGGFKDAQWFAFLLVAQFQCSIQAIL